MGRGRRTEEAPAKTVEGRGCLKWRKRGRTQTVASAIEEICCHSLITDAMARRSPSKPGSAAIQIVGSISGSTTARYASVVISARATSKKHHTSSWGGGGDVRIEGWERFYE